MYDDAEARKTVRELIQCFEAFAARSTGLAFVVARKDPREYERILESAERAEEFIAKPMLAADPKFQNIYAALDNADSNWCEAIKAMLKPGPNSLYGDEAFARMEFMRGISDRFEEEERKAQEGWRGDAGFAT